MPPRSDDNTKVKSSLGIKLQPHREYASRYGMTWLADRRKMDGAEGLWRIHDNLYDLTDFINKHPGGPDWLTLTKGTDITEAFETHHFTDHPEQILKKYYIRKAKAERSVPFSFKKDDFYMTLKREVSEALKTIPKQPVRTTAFLIDALAVGAFLFAILGCCYWNFWLAALSGSLLASTAIAAHNYFHQKDNFRMYYFNFSMMNVTEWRISHVLSHHLHTNTVIDMEVFGMEPLLRFPPTEKSPLKKYGAVALSPFLWMTQCHMSFYKYLYTLYHEGKEVFRPSDLLFLALPFAMYVVGGQSILATLGMWTFIILVCSFQFYMIGFNAAHHHPDIFHDGDTPRATKDYDWGLSQLDAVMDRVDITGSHYLVLTNFGDHALHHLFPTLDHGILEHLYPVLYKVMEQFDYKLRLTSQLELVKGQFKQVMRTVPNPNPPDLNKKYL